MFVCLFKNVTHQYWWK